MKMNVSSTPLEITQNQIVQQTKSESEPFQIRNYFKKFSKSITNNFKSIFKLNKDYISEPESVVENQKNKKSKKKENSIYENIFHFALFIISYIFYFASLLGCYEGEDLCSKKPLWVIFAILSLLISIIISIILFSLMIHNRVSQLNLIHFIIAYILFYQYSHDTLSEDHGYYNFLFFFSFVWLSIFVELLVHGLVLLIKSRYRYFIFLIIILLIISFILIYKINLVNCDEWSLGLNNTYLQNDKNKYGCQIKLPKVCTYKIFQNTQDITKIKKIDCTKEKKDARKILLNTLTSPFVNNNTKKVGYPKTNADEIGGIDGKDKWVLLNYTYENMLDMNNITREIEHWPEQIVDFTKKEIGELNINLTYNDTLSKERKKLEKNSNPYANNIMILYIDSVSRACAMRQLKKTMSFFEKFMPYQGSHHEKYPNENFHSFQFFKYHCFRMFTAGNYPLLFYGNKIEANDLVLITKYLKENGYVTNYCSDECKKDNTRTHHNFTKSEMYDHQMLLCDPNVEPMNKKKKKCLYGNINTYHLYEYGKQFWTKYKDNRKYSALVTNDGHESTLEALKYSDDIIYNYLTSLYNDNLLKDTTILMVSDHGTGLPSIYYLNDFFQIEHRLPMLFILVNDRKNVSYNEQYYNIQQNQQTFVTAYDFYNTIGYLLYGDKYVDILNKTNDNDTPKSSFGQSLFDYIDPKTRSPKNYENMDTNICK